MKILNFFRKNIETKRSPEIGEVWTFHSSDGSPWPKVDEKVHKVTILDVKDGWVRYKWNNTSVWQDERMKMNSFTYCYRFESTVAWDTLKEK